MELSCHSVHVDVEIAGFRRARLLSEPYCVLTAACMLCTVHTVCVYNVSFVA